MDPETMEMEILIQNCYRSRNLQDMWMDYDDSSFDTPLLRSVVHNNRIGVREALENGFSANLHDHRGWTPVHEAAIHNDRSECLKELLSHSSADINRQTRQLETPLFLACKHKCFNAVKVLLDNPNCNINLPNGKGVSPLNEACWEKDINIIKVLVHHRANVNLCNFKGRTPLHKAVMGPCGIGSRDRMDELSHEICSYLLNNGAKSQADKLGNLPLHYACRNGLLKCVNLLCCPDPNTELSFSAIQISVNLTNVDNQTPLMMAVESKNCLLVEMLLSFGANADVKDDLNTIALHRAASSANYEIFNLVKKATSHKAIMETCTLNEAQASNKQDLVIFRSLICNAIDTNDLEFLTKVLETDLDQNVLHCPIKTLELQTPIYYLLQEKMHDLGDKIVNFLQLLIDHGSPIRVTSKNSSLSYGDPLLRVFSYLHGIKFPLLLKCLQLLLMNGADPDKPPRDTKYGRMPDTMQAACWRDCPDVAILLLQYSNVLEPDDIIIFIAEKVSYASEQKKIIKVMLSLTPNYFILAQHLQNDCRFKNLLQSLQVPTLSSFCRATIRKQLHEETKHSPNMFRQSLLDLPIPKGLQNFLSYM